MKTKLCIAVLLFINFLECGKKPEKEPKNQQAEMLTNRVRAIQKQIKTLRTDGKLTKEKKKSFKHELSFINQRFSELQAKDNDVLFS